MKINKILVGAVSAILLSWAAILLPVFGQGPQTPPASTDKQQVVITDAQRFFSTLNVVECIDWSWATPEQKYKTGENGWGNWRPQNGEKGEVVFIATHCSSKIKLYIVKIGQYYVPMPEAAFRFVRTPGEVPPAVGQSAMIIDRMRIYTTVNANACLDWSWATAEERNRSGESGWGGFFPTAEAIGEVVFIADHCDTKDKVYILKIGPFYVPVNALGLNVMPTGDKRPVAPTGQSGLITNSGSVFDTLNQTQCLDWSWASPAQKYMSGSNGWGKWRPNVGDQGEIVLATTHCDKTKLYVVKIGDYYVPVAESGLKVAASDGSTYAKTVLPPKTADDHVKLGDECYSKEDLACAIANYTRAVELSPGSWLAYYLRGQSFAESGKPADATADYNRAIDILTKLISVKPDAEALSRRAFLYAKRSGNDDASLAVADCTQAIKIDPNFALAYQVRAAVYRYLKRIPEAESDEQKAKQLLPK